MPIYDYRCDDKECGEEQERLVKSFDALPPKCKACEGTTTKLVSRGGSFRLDGIGWERDGYGCRGHWVEK